jgi:hypothetical protein
LKKNSESARARERFLRLGILGAVVLAALIGAAGRSGAASPVIFPSQNSMPGDGVAVAYSGVVGGQSDYVSYTIGFQRGADNNNLSHARVSEPVNCTGTGTTTACTDSGLIGATVVSVTGTITVGSTTTPFCTAPVGRTDPTIGAGVTCPIGALAPNSFISLTIVFKMPTKLAACAAQTFDNRAALLVDESINDSQPQSNHQDTFATSDGGMTTLLTCDAANALDTFTLPGTAASFQTDATPGAGNFQASAVKWGSVTPAGFPGGGLRLFECGIPGGAQGTACDPSVANPCGPVPCVTQTSVINVPGNLGAYFIANPMTITLTFFPSDFPKGFNWRKLVIYHDTHQVRTCPDTTFDVDCLSSLILDKATGNVIATIVGPANGGWGGI